jgi:RNA polymerase sigma-70 factor (ECF subfamily)
MEKHIGQCARCRQDCDSLKKTLAMCRTAAPAVAVPRDVQDSVKVALRDFLARQA